MIMRLTRISPWQSAKTLAAVYFAMGVVIAIPAGLFISQIPAPPGQSRLSVPFILCLPILYALAALIFVPLACWIYNLGAGLLGGIEFTVETRPDTK
jgi:hypothetical protein